MNGAVARRHKPTHHAGALVAGLLHDLREASTGLSGGDKNVSGHRRGSVARLENNT